jgi:L-ascorbate metabolism protein UlaG (beta-lactamase superfamily)
LRANPPGIAFDALPKIDVVLVSHNHYDHLDTTTLGRLWQRDRPKIITPLGNDTIMKSAVPGLEATTGDWGQSFAIGGAGGQYRVHLVPTQHWSARGLRDRFHALWASFVLTPEPGTQGPRVYAVGDSGFGSGSTFRHVAERVPGIDVALLPIGAYEPRWFMQTQHMNPADAVEAFTLCGTQRAYGHHWGTFKLTNEGHERPVEHLAEALAAKGIAPERFVALKPGQTVAF